MFLALVLCQDKSRTGGLHVFDTSNGGAMLLWKHDNVKSKNTLVEWKVLFDSMVTKSADLKDEFLL